MGARRHREWSDEKRLEILREAFSPGAVVSHCAPIRCFADVIYILAPEALRRAEAAFVPAVIEDEPLKRKRRPDPTLRI
jgi:transposase